MKEAATGRSVLFRARLWPAALVMFTIMMLSVIVLWMALGLLVGVWPAPGWDLLLVLAVPIVGAFGHSMTTVSLWRRRPVWVRVSDAGVELATGGAPVFIEWANVATASMHRRGVFAVLDVIPITLQRVTTTAPGRTVPRVRRLPDGAGFRVPV